jgi:ABC-type multidrug transport system fused ATPase/permease subunit
MTNLINFHLNKRLFLLFTGIFIFMFIIWNRFIRVRLPKDVPFILTDLSLILLLITCIILLVTLILIIKAYLLPKHQTNTFIKLGEFYTESLQELDATIKRNPYIWKR